MSSSNEQRHAEDARHTRHERPERPEQEHRQPQGFNPGVAVIGFLLCFLAGAGLMCGYEEERHRNGGPSAAGVGGGAAGGAAWSDDESPVPVTSKDPVWGKRDAPVTIVVFSDFECPYCAKVAPTFEQLRTTYGPDKLRIVWKNQPLPFHSHARPAAEAAQGVFALAGSDAFWSFHDAAFKNNTALTSDNFEKWAREAGVTGADLSKLRAGLAAHTWSEKVDRDMSIAKTAGISSTPSFVVNGVPLIGAQPFDKFKILVDQELAKAQAKIAAGTARDRVYVVMSQDNKKSAPQAAADDEPKEDTKTVWKVPVSQSPALGDSGALVTVVAFLDFECPYCKQGDALLRKIRETNGDKVRIVFKNQVLPFHSRALPSPFYGRGAFGMQYTEPGAARFSATRFGKSPELEGLAKRPPLRAAHRKPRETRGKNSGSDGRDDFDSCRRVRHCPLGKLSPRSANFFRDGRLHFYARARGRITQ